MTPALSIDHTPTHTSLPAHARLCYFASRDFPLSVFSLSAVVSSVPLLFIKQSWAAHRSINEPANIPSSAPTFLSLSYPPALPLPFSRPLSACVSASCGVHLSAVSRRHCDPSLLVLPRGWLAGAHRLLAAALLYFSLSPVGKSLLGT